MHSNLISLLFEHGEPPGGDEATYGRLLIFFGWLSKDHYEWTRKTPLLWRAWKRHCKSLMPKKIGDESVHMKNDHLSLTTRSRCYTANEQGYFVPHGGNGGARCQNMEHYYEGTLRVKWPQPRDGLAFNKTRYVDWTLQKYVVKNKRRVAWEEEMERKVKKHRELCDNLAERPWMFRRLEGLASDTLFITKAEKEERLDFIDFYRTKRKRQQQQQQHDGRVSSGSGSSGDD